MLIEKAFFRCEAPDICRQIGGAVVILSEVGDLQPFEVAQSEEPRGTRETRQFRRVHNVDASRPRYCQDLLLGCLS